MSPLLVLIQAHLFAWLWAHMETLFIAATDAWSNNSLIKLSFQAAFDWFNNCDTIKQELLVGSFGIGKKPGISIREPQVLPNQNILPRPN